MSTATSCGTTSFTGRLVIVFPVLYPAIVGLWQMTAVKQAPARFSVIPATLAPLFVGSAGTWLGLAATAEALALFGGGRASTAAGIAEALSKTTMGGVVAAVVALVMLPARGGAPSVPPTTLVRAMTFVLSATVVALLVNSLPAARTIGYATPSLLVTVAAIGGAGAVVSLGWFLASRRHASLQIQSCSGCAAAACALVSAAIALASWQAAELYIYIAMHG